MVHIGDIVGETSDDAAFSYDEAYLDLEGAIPICLALPLGSNPFSPEQTRRYFDGLLPEGFTRRSVAGALHAEESDYLSLLASLGSECIGAVLAVEDGQGSGDAELTTPHYRQLSESELLALAREGASESAQIVVESRVSLAGASGKVGLYRRAPDGAWMLPMGTAPSTHIVKQGHVRYDSMVLNERLCLAAAEKCGIPVSHTFVIPTEEPLFATERFDRDVVGTATVVDGCAIPARLHQQDFGQALGIPTSEKYESGKTGYIAKGFELVRTRSTSPREDVLALWDYFMFNLVIGNLDNHVKNHALIYSKDWRSLRVAPLYDAVSTLAYPGTSRALPMSLGSASDIRDVTRSSVAQASHDAGIGEKLALDRLDRIMDRALEAISESASELADQGFSEVCDISRRIEGVCHTQVNQLSVS